METGLERDEKCPMSTNRSVAPQRPAHPHFGRFARCSRDPSASIPIIADPEDPRDEANHALEVGEIMETGLERDEKCPVSTNRSVAPHS